MQFSRGATLMGYKDPFQIFDLLRGNLDHYFNDLGRGFNLQTEIGTLVKRDATAKTNSNHTTVAGANTLGRVALPCRYLEG